LEIKEICKVAHDNDAIVVFDAAHISGLIIGKQYTNPFDDGVDIITTSTCKTIPGPQHGLILTNKKYGEIIKRTTFPALHSSHHLHHTVATIITLYEMSIFGNAYAKQIRRNITRLADNLNKNGFKIYSYEKDKFTDTHMIMLLSENATNDERMLEKAGILVNKNLLPWDESYKTPSALRIGVPEVTRIGMQERNMDDIAKYMHRVLILGENPAKIRLDVKIYIEQFKNICFCYPKSHSLWGQIEYY